MRRFSLTRVLIALLVVLLLVGGLYRYGRSIWHPIYIKLAGGTTIEERINAIETKKPALMRKSPERLSLLCFKTEKRVEMYLDGQHAASYPFTANSGTLGPKLREGDRQIPEGIYTLDVMNPNSSYYLSLRVSYPNARDLERAKQNGISDPGGDIYIHGKSMSIGCIAIGDGAIEEVFYRVHQVGLDNTQVIIAPRDFRMRPPAKDSEYAELYAEIQQALMSYPQP